ncbi:C-GCAxxG-C-C family protein [Candidatus Methanarcanum hacksteinii]|uniref:C-GCAxxG-C-C family protein n=1 Tax=Candidatus Methanarcanum hacksteinii TaxID=2911857 RepID=UPI0037DCF1AC
MLSEKDVDRLFDMGFDCSQIVFGEFAERFGLKKEDAYRIAGCFGIGMAQDGVCGAVSGGMMALGLAFGNDAPEDLSKKDALFKMRDELVKEFKIRNADVNCPELLGQKVHTLEDLMLTRPTGIYKDCPKYCIDVIEIVEKMLH